MRRVGESKGRSSPAGSFGRAGAAVTLLEAPAAFYVLTLAMTTVSRGLLVIWEWERVTAPGTVMLSGLRMDVLVLSMVSIPLVLGTLLLSITHRLGALWRKLLRVALVAWAAFFFYLELATPSFIEEYDARPNRLFFEYLGHPREVFSMIFEEQPLLLISTTLLCLVFVRGAWVLFGKLVREPRRVGVPARLAVAIVILPMLFLGARSSLRHRPANPSSVALWPDHLVNDLCLSSGYSVLYALYRMRDEADASAVYGDMRPERAAAEVRAAMSTVASEDFTDPERPTLHLQHVRGSARPKNLVILLEESMGAQYSAALGGLGVTPELDGLREAGWWFENLYATGTRSVRGIEAVVTGFPPTPARAVVKLGKAQSGFFTLASFLADRGYRTQFVYGGESQFDNMRGFLSGNGFEEIFDQDDYEHPRFAGSWGVCDEDIFQKAHETFLANGDEPFFSLVFSVSNHSPFEFPDGAIELHDAEQATRNNSVKYADHALGGFFDLARGSSYWDDTVFLVVADHDSRVSGATLVPVEHFRIPGVILGAGIEPRVDARVASQLDLAPTLLSLIGVGGEHPMIGHDLTRLDPNAAGRAIMQYGENQAFMEGERVVVLRPDLEPAQFVHADGELLPAPLDPALADRALGHAVLASWLYDQQAYAAPRLIGELAPEQRLVLGP